MSKIVSLIKFEPIVKQEHKEATFDLAKTLLVRCFLQQYVSTVKLYLQHKSKLHNMVTSDRCYTISDLAVFVISFEVC